jgi:hypothetical protein
MYETDEEHQTLQALLDTSLPRSSDHLRSIVKPGERTLTARQLTSVLTGMCTLSAATVTAKGAPRISAVDGHFLHGRWVFSTSGTAVKARHLRARPDLSVAHIRGDDLGVFTHGTAQFIEPDQPDWKPIDEHLTNHYGSSPWTWEDEIVYLRVVPHWMVAYAFDPAKLLGDTAGTP